MEKKRNGQTIIIAVLAVAILFMSVGFAAFTANLSINGKVKVEPTKWSVHWNTTSYALSPGSVPVTNQDLETGTTPTLSDNAVTFGAKLSKPGDYAEFTINAINDGDFDAKLTGITMSSLTEAQSKYLSYTVTYAGTTYNGSATGLNVVLPKDGSNSVTVKVKVTYEMPANSSDLPTATDNIVTLSAAFDYAQSI